jgi:hypothetical protein
VSAPLVFTRSLIGVTFLLSALSKVGNANGVRLFADTLVQLRLARPGRPAVAAAIAVGSVEALVTLVLLPLGAGFTRLAFLLAMALLAAFSVVIARSVRRHDQVACRCFGGSTPAPFSAVHLVRNTFLLLVALAGGVVAEHQAASWPLWLILAPAGAACAFVISRLDDVVSLFKTA